MNTDVIKFYDGKAVNAQAFGAYISEIAKTRENKLINANIFTADKNVNDTFRNSVGNIYAVLPILGDFKGEAQNYDGVSDLSEGEGVDSYLYGVTSYGRALVGGEYDYANEIAGKSVDFREHLAKRMGEKWVDIREDTLISIIKGMFSSTTDGADEFAEAHTLEIEGKIAENSLNDASQKALGDKDFNGKGAILTIMHSKIANNLRNKKLLEYMKYTDENGMEKNSNLAQWGDKLVLVDDSITTMKVTTDTYATTTDTALDNKKTYYTRSGSASAGYTYTEVTSPKVADISSYYEKTTTITGTKYVTYGIGAGTFIRDEDLPVDVPFERYRNPYKKGGKVDLINRERKVLHPKGFSFLKKNVATDSPTDKEFADGANWGLAKNSDGTKYYPHQLIPVIRIVSTEV